MTNISFFVSGIPKPAGSKRGFVMGKRAVLVDASGQAGKDWRGDVKHVGKEAYKGPLLDEPLILTVTFYYDRPKSHYYTGKRSHILRDNAPKYKETMPDATKLLRAVEDALTKVLWHDDARICVQYVKKVYCGETERPGAEITVATLEVE